MTDKRAHTKQDSKPEGVEPPTANWLEGVHTHGKPEGERGAAKRDADLAGRNRDSASASRDPSLAPDTPMERVTLWRAKGTAGGDEYGPWTRNKRGAGILGHDLEEREFVPASLLDTAERRAEVQTNRAGREKLRAEKAEAERDTEKSRAEEAEQKLADYEGAMALERTRGAIYEDLQESEARREEAERVLRELTEATEDYRMKGFGSHGLVERGERCEAAARLARDFLSTQRGHRQVEEAERKRRGAYEDFKQARANAEEAEAERDKAVGLIRRWFAVKATVSEGSSLMKETADFLTSLQDGGG